MLRDRAECRPQVTHQPSSTVPAAIRLADVGLELHVADHLDAVAEGEVTVDLQRVALRSDGAPSGKRWSKSPTSR